MGTTVSFDVRDPDARPSAITEVVDWLHHVDAVFSPYKLDSTISALGRGELRFDELTDEVRDVLRLCELMRQETGGTFDVFAVPAPNGTTLDPSGLVKGWSIERAAELLEAEGCHNFCINAGGDISLRGRPGPGQRWRVGVRHPDDPGRISTVIEGAERLAVATSGTYERGGHIIDPRDGLPVTTLASVTVVGPDLTIADVYATAAFVMGEHAIGWIESRPGYEGLAIEHRSSMSSTSGFAAYVDAEPGGNSPPCRLTA